MVWFVGRNDLCGFICAIMTLLLTIYAWMVQFFIILGPWYGYFSMEMILYTFITGMAVTSHMRTMLTDPGAVPLELEKKYVEIDKQEVDKEEEDGKMGEETKIVLVRNECRKCRNWKPLDAHHCSTCKRCILRLDHHCVWVCNCVGLFNQKNFLLFLFYTFSMCLFCGFTLVGRFFSCSSAQAIIYQTCTVGPLGAIAGILNFVEAIIFGMFTIIMTFDQIGAIFDNTPYIDSIQGKRGEKRGRMESLNDVFGERFTWKWFFPFAPTKKMFEDYEKMCLATLKKMERQELRTNPFDADAVTVTKFQ